MIAGTDGIGELVTTGGRGGEGRDCDDIEEGDSAGDPETAELGIGGLKIDEEVVKTDVRAGGGAGP